jgi:hypothetical protein
MYIQTSDSHNYLERSADFSDRIKGSKGLVDRLFAPIEEMEHWDRAEIESCLRLLEQERYAQKGEIKRLAARHRELSEKNRLETNEGAKVGRNVALAKVVRKITEHSQRSQEIGMQRNRLQLLLMKINTERYLDIYQKAVVKVVDAQTAALIDREYWRMKVSAEQGT